MALDKDINKALDKLANLIVENYKVSVGDEPTDFFVQDMAKSIVKMPIWGAQSKRKYIDKLFADMESQLAYDSEGRDNPTRYNQEYYKAKNRYESLAPRLEQEAQSYDLLAEAYKTWFHDYTGQEFSLDYTYTPNRKRSKAEQNAMAAIEARRAQQAKLAAE